MSLMWMSSGIYISTISHKEEEGKNFGLFFGILYFSGLFAAIFLIIIIPNASYEILFKEIVYLSIIAIFLFMFTDFENVQLDNERSDDTWNSTLYESTNSGSL